jgi:uncharacterized RDD family membrane protein YckC
MFTIIGGDGKEYGPVSTEQIREWLAAGRANLETKAKIVGTDEWRRVADFPEFAAATAMGVSPALPLQSADPMGLLPLASRWARLGSALLDSVVGCVFVLPGLIMMFMVGGFSGWDKAPRSGVFIVGMLLIFVGFVAVIVVQLYLLSTRGQTIGKKLLSIRIVTFDTESNPGFVKAFLLRMFVNGIIGAIPVVGPVYSIVDLCFIFRGDKRCIHDLIAGTKVVKG